MMRDNGKNVTLNANPFESAAFLVSPKDFLTYFVSVTTVDMEHKKEDAGKAKENAIKEEKKKNEPTIDDII